MITTKARQREERIKKLITFFTAIGNFFKRLNKTLILAVIACSVLSVIMLWSMEKNGLGKVYLYTIKVQVVAISIGLLLALIFTIIDYHILAKLCLFFSPIAVGLVILTFVYGVQREGADDKAWLDLGFTSLQPSELLKVVFIVTFALHLTKIDKTLNKWHNVLLLCVHAAIPIGLIVKQGDYGTAIVFTVIFITMIFSAGISLKYIITALILSPGLCWLAWEKFIGDIQKNRILILFQPGTDPLGLEYQQDLGLATLGSGQLFGRGLIAPEGVQFKEVPEMKNDFIFAYVGQTLGFIGALGLTVVLIFITINLLATAKLANDKLGSLICTGAFALFLTHIVLNICMVLKVFPVIGLPLPFVSAGGTAIVAMYSLIGIVMSIYFYKNKERKK